MVRFTPSGRIDYRREDPDVRLMLRVRSGDDEAFVALWQKYYGHVCRILDHLMGNRQQTEDLAQEVFLRVYRARKTYQPNSKFCTWLFTIVNNVASNAKRSLATRQRCRLPLNSGNCGWMLDQRTADRQVCDGGDAVLRQELSELVRDAVDSLNDRQRTAVMLCGFEQLSHAEAARRMRTSPEAVKSLLHRARVNLRLRLEDYVDGGLLGRLQSTAGTR